jgi:hypothetical protein
MRLLLLKQDEISVLEERLDDLDSREDRELFLGSIRRDVNPERRQLIQVMQRELEEYGKDERRPIQLSLPTQVLPKYCCHGFRGKAERLQWAQAYTRFWGP